MAVFNPPISNTPSHNYISYSQGTTPDRSLGTLFEGIGAAVKTGFQEKDNYEKAKIDKAVAASITGIDNEILGGVTPQELIDGKVSADKIRAAYDQGKLSASYRDARIARTAKELSLKYPDQTQYIWNNISNMAGTSPVGGLIQDYRSELNASQNEADASAKEMRSFVNSNGEYIGSDVFQNAYKAATGSAFDAENFDYATAQSIINKQKAYKENLNLQHSEITAAKDAKSWSDEVTYDKISTMLSDSRTQIFGAAGDSPAPSLTGEYRTIYQAIQTAAANPNAVTEEERMAISQSLVQLEMDMSTYADSLFAAKGPNGESINSKITDPAKRKQLKDEFLAPLQVLKEAVTNKDYGTLNAIATENKMRQDSTAKKVLDATGDLASKFAKADAMIGQQNRQALVQNLLAGVASDGEKVLAQSLGLDIITGEKTVSEAITDYGKAGGYTLNASAPQKVLLNVPDAILAMPKEQAAQAAEKVYSDPQFLSKLTQANSIAVFEKYVNPRMTEMLKGTSAWDEYNRWAQGNFATVLTKFKSDTIGILSDLPGAEITFNYNTGRFNPFVPPSNIPTDAGMGGRGTGAVMLNRQNIQKANEAVATINRWLDAVSPIVETSGFTKEDAPVLALQQGFGSNQFGKIKGENQKGILQMLYDGFVKGLSNINETPEQAKKNRWNNPKDNSEAKPQHQSMIDYSRGMDVENVKVNEAYGPGRPGRPDSSVRNIAVAAAAGAGMENITFTSGKGNTISAAGRARGQKSTMHSTGKALDVTGFKNDEQKWAFIENAVANGAEGIGIYSNGSVHIDEGRERHWDWSGDPENTRRLNTAIEAGLARRKKTQVASK